MSKRIWILGLLSLLAPPSVWANPISVDAFRVRQMDKSLDVQVTYGVDSGSGASTVKIVSLTRDDKAITPTSWLAASYKANTGSGVRSLSASQHCDCSVSKGKHTYELKVQGVMGSGKTTSYKVTVDVQDGGPAAKDAGSAKGGDMAPWEIPEPSDVQGANCTIVCKANAGNDGGAADGGAKVEQETDGCAVAGGAGAGAGILVLLLIGLLFRRSKSSKKV